MFVSWLTVEERVLQSSESAVQSAGERDVHHPWTVLHLEPEPRSPQRARRFLRALLAEAGRERWQDAAELAVTEVVTNAVLHAHTPLEVRARVQPGELRVEVLDTDPRLPRAASHGAPALRGDATTGRGLDLVAAVSADSGVQPVLTGGKVVWFVVRDPDADAGVDDLLDRWDVDLDVELAAPAGQLRRVMLRAMPPALWQAASDHHDALLREYLLYTAGTAGGSPGERVTVAERTWSWMTGALPAPGAVEPHDARVLRSAPVPQDVEPHDARVLQPAPQPRDVELRVPPDAEQEVRQLQDVLDDAERLAGAGLLLAQPGLPEVVALRDWACEQVVVQLAAGAGSPWPGADQPRFTVDGRDRARTAPLPEAARRVLDGVRASDRGVVAADGANRIVAVSRPLADALGWAPDDLVGRRVVTLVPPSFREAHLAGVSRHLTTGTMRILGQQLHMPVLHADGHTVSCSFVLQHEAPQDGGRLYLAWITPDP